VKSERTFTRVPEDNIQIWGLCIVSETCIREGYPRVCSLLSHLCQRAGGGTPFPHVGDAFVNEDGKGCSYIIGNWTSFQLKCITDMDLPW
jgi:hypothetical protein